MNPTNHISEPRIEQKILWITLEYFSEYDFLTKNDFLFITEHIDICFKYYDMLHHEYILFLPKSQFYITKYVPSCIPYFTKKSGSATLKETLESSHITVIEYEQLSVFQYFLDLINRFHKKHPCNDFMENYIVKIGELLASQNQNQKYDSYLWSHAKSKEYYFYENLFLPNVLYKKIQLSKIVQFISLEHYAYKKNEYMLRSFSQIAEELGAIKIHIKHHYINDDERISKLGITTNHRLHRKHDQKEEHEMEFNFAYSDHNYINLNEFLLKNKILNENKFLLSKEDFESNLELKYLISARCKNFIEKYYTQFKSSTLNSKEIHILCTLQEFQINIENINIISEHIETTLKIDFLNVLDHISLIDGGNLFPLKEGYIYLKQILGQEGDYCKYIYFLKAHLHAVQNKYAYLSYDYEYIDSIMKIYHQCIELNFHEAEFAEYITHYWKNNREWYHFTLLRDMILLGNDNADDKIHFVSFQYMSIFKEKYAMLRKMETFLYSMIDPLIDIYISKSMNDEEEDANSDHEKEREQMECKKRILATRSDRESSSTEDDHEDGNDDKEAIMALITRPTVYVDLYTEIRNKIFGYQFLDDDVEKKSCFMDLYFKYVQYIKNKSVIPTVPVPYEEEKKQLLFSNHLFKERLKKNQFQKRIVDLILKGVKGSFYYEHGMSNNITNQETLKETILNVIYYYFKDEIYALQELVCDFIYVKKHAFIDIPFFIDHIIHLLCSVEDYTISPFILKSIFEKKSIETHRNKKNETKPISKKKKHIRKNPSFMIQLQSVQEQKKVESIRHPWLSSNEKGEQEVRFRRQKRRMIKKRTFTHANLHDSIQMYMDDNTSPILMNDDQKEMSILDQTKMIFSKWLFKHFEDSHMIEKEIEKIPIQHLLTNYRKHRIFFTYSDYQKMIVNIKNEYKDVSNKEVELNR